MLAIWSSTQRADPEPRLSAQNGLAGAGSRATPVESLLPWRENASPLRVFRTSYCATRSVALMAGLLRKSRPLYSNHFSQDMQPDEIAILTEPEVDPHRIRVAGPFTVEALSRYAVNPNQDNVPPEPDDPQASEPQDHIHRLLDALAKQGIPRKGGLPAQVSR